MSTAFEQYMNPENQFRTVNRTPIHELRRIEDTLHAEWDIAFALWCEAIRKADGVDIRTTKGAYEAARERYLSAHADTQDAIYDAELAARNDHE